MTRSTTRWAVVVSEVLAPWVLAAVMPVLIAAATTTPLWRGVLTGLLVTLVCAVVPYTVVAVGVRRGRYEDHHVRNREDRPKLMAMVAGLTVLTAGLLVLIDASPASLVLLGLMTSCALVGFAVSRFWKISLHAMVATASAVVVVGFFPAWFPVLLAVPLVALARVRVRAHSPAQVVAGTGAGAVLAAVAVVLATG